MTRLPAPLPRAATRTPRGPWWSSPARQTIDLATGNERAQEASDRVDLADETTLRLATGDVVRRVLEEVRRGGHTLLIVGSSPIRGALQTYMLGDRTRDIVRAAGRPFLVLRSAPAGFWTEIWRSLKEGAATGAAGSPQHATPPALARAAARSQDERHLR